MTKGKPSLLDRAKAIQKQRRQMWIDKLPVGQRTEVVAVLNAKIDGELEATVADIVDLFVQEGVKTATPNTVQNAITTLRKERDVTRGKGQKPR